MTKGAVHPNGSNFRRIARLDVVARVRRLCEARLLAERPKWLEWCERVPPMENHNLKLQARTIRNPYPQMVNHLLKKYPDLRFQDCYVDGNDWSVGNDAYRDDHPVMQFVARQLDFMRTDGLSKREAFARTEELFRERRQHLEREQKVMMAMALDSGVAPMFTTGKAYLQEQKAKAEAAHLEIIRRRLRNMKKDAVEEQKRMEGQQQEEELAQLPIFKEAGRRQEEREAVRDADKTRQELVGFVAKDAVEEPAVEEAVLAEPGEEEAAKKLAPSEGFSKEASLEDEGLGELKQYSAPVEEAEAARTEREGATPTEAPMRQMPDVAKQAVDQDILVTQRVPVTKAEKLGSMLGSSPQGVAGEDLQEDDQWGMRPRVRPRASMRRPGPGADEDDDLGGGDGDAGTRGGQGGGR